MKRPIRSRASTFLLLFGLITGAGVVATQMATGCFNVETDCANSLDRDGCQGALALNVTTSSSTTSSTTSSSSSNSSSTGTTTSSSSTGSSSSSGMPACAPSNCSVPAGTCYPYGTADCDAGKCELTYAPAQIPDGTCRMNVCETNGNLGWNALDTNTYNDGTGCNSYPCDGGMNNLNVPVPAAAGTPCVLSTGQSGYCEPNPDPTAGKQYVCSTCDPNTTPSSCPSTRTCSQGNCVPVGCTQGGTGEGETDVDCGGTLCVHCATNQKCKSGTDCFSQVCVDGGCAGPTCTDGQLNAQETAADCGGPFCPGCANGQNCLLPRDCVSKVCLPSSISGAPNTCAAPTCHDGVQNGSETGIDCGGSCNPCDGG